MSLQAVASVINAVGAEAGVGAGACAEEGSEEREEEEEACRVLSIQSHVVSGCVGNKAAVFPLQVLGFEVDYVNSVQFSNHTGYPMGVKGTVLSGTELLSLLDGLSLNHLTHSYEYVLTGYIGSETFLDSVLRVLDKVKEDSPGMRYVCDPVLGDNHQYYVPQALVQIFREKLIPRAYMITPNQFEAELLTTTTIDSETAAVSALLALHSLGPQIVMLTSAEFPTDPGVLHCYVLFHNPLPTLQSGSGSGNGNVGGSGSDSGSGSGSVGGSGVLGSGLSDLCVSKVVIRKQAGHYTGTGDATAALMLAWVHSLKAAAASTSSTSAPIHPTSTSAPPTSTPLTSTSTPIPPSSTPTHPTPESNLHPVSQALLCSLSTVGAMLRRSGSRLARQQAKAKAQMGVGVGAGVGAGEGADVGARVGKETDTVETEAAAAATAAALCALTHARELQVVASKGDIERPPVHKLGHMSFRTWRL